MESGRTIALVNAQHKLAEARLEVLVAAAALSESPTRAELCQYAAAISQALHYLDNVLALVQLERVPDSE